MPEITNSGTGCHLQGAELSFQAGYVSELYPETPQLVQKPEMTNRGRPEARNDQQGASRRQ